MSTKKKRYYQISMKLHVLYSELPFYKEGQHISNLLRPLISPYGSISKSFSYTTNRDTNNKIYAIRATFTSLSKAVLAYREIMRQIVDQPIMRSAELSFVFHIVGSIRRPYLEEIKHDFYDAAGNHVGTSWDLGIVY